MCAEVRVRIGAFPQGARMERRGGLTAVYGVPIGIDFHWSRSMTFLLPGRVEAVPAEGGGEVLYNTLPLEDYLACVVSSEMNPEAPLEFLKAHAVISRSWIMNVLRGVKDVSGKPRGFVTWEDAEGHDDCDVCADDHCQRYQGAGSLNDAARRAVEETRGFLLRDSCGNVADARFSKCCGGRTELFSTCWQERDHDYLRSVACPHCDLSSMPRREARALLDTVLKGYDRPTGFHDWRARVDCVRLRREVLRRYGVDLGPIKGMEAVQRGPSGRIKLLRLLGAGGEVTLGKELAIRRLLSPDCLLSSAFTVLPSPEPYPASLEIAGRGWGHGVGLCQIGAARMARDGASCQEILSHYYPTTTLSK